jgi:hypothetical protein
MEFKLESRTEEWFALALERGLHENIAPDDVGAEVRQLGFEQRPIPILKAWEARGLIATIHPQLARRHPHYDLLGRIVRARDDLTSVGLRPRLFAAVTLGVLGKLKSRERAAVLHRLGFRSSEAAAVLHLDGEAQKVAKMLAGRKTAQPPEAFSFLEKTRTDLIVFILAESSNTKVLNKIRNYLRRWRPLRLALPAAALELEALGMARGPKFDKVMESLFHLQLVGKGRTPEDRIKLLRKLAGIKEPSKVKEEKKRPVEKKKLVGKQAAESAAAELADKISAASVGGPAGAPGATPARTKQLAQQAVPVTRTSRPAGKSAVARAKAAVKKH